MNSCMFTSVLSAFAALEFLNRGKLAHALAMKIRLLNVVSTANALVTMHEKCGY